VPSVHVAQLGLLSASDAQIWQKATDLGATIVSKDQDFVEHAKRSPFGPQVVWLRLGNMRNEALWLRLTTVLDEIVAALDAGERVIEVE
jgi:predicted nuclease of predicted toxin-antitoxin system